MEHVMTDEEWGAPLDDETEAQIAAALAQARDFYPYEVATAVQYIPSYDLLLLVMKTGDRVALAVENIQGLADADRQAVANFALLASGSVLHWEQLDVDFSTEGLAEGRTGNEYWMKRLQERKRRADAADALSQTA